MFLLGISLETEAFHTLKLIQFFCMLFSHTFKVKSLTKKDFTNFSAIARNNFLNMNSECTLSTNNFKLVMAYVLAGILNQR